MIPPTPQGRQPRSAAQQETVRTEKRDSREGRGWVMPLRLYPGEAQMHGSDAQSERLSEIQTPSEGRTRRQRRPSIRSDSHRSRSGDEGSRASYSQRSRSPSDTLGRATGRRPPVRECAASRSLDPPRGLATGEQRGSRGCATPSHQDGEMSTFLSMQGGKLGTPRNQGYTTQGVSSYMDIAGEVADLVQKYWLTLNASLIELFTRSQLAAAWAPVRRPGGLRFPWVLLWKYILNIMLENFLFSLYLSMCCVLA